MLSAAMLGADVAMTMAMDLANLGREFLFDQPQPTLMADFALSHVVVAMAAIVLLALGLVWRAPGWRLGRRLHHTAFALVLAGLAVMIVTWGLRRSRAALRPGGGLTPVWGADHPEHCPYGSGMAPTTGLDELIGNLELDQPALAGHSYGGWIALGAAVLRPRRLGPVTVIAPASGLVPFHWYMALFLRVAEYLPFRPSAESVLRAQVAPGWQPDPDFVDLMEAMTRHLRTEVPFPVPFDAAFLARIVRPLQVVLAGAKCSMIRHEPQRVPE